MRNLQSITGEDPITLAPLDDKARRRSNVAPGYTLPFTAASLEAGVTLETLLSLPVPVFAYATQLTIHGRLPEMEKPIGKSGGYKNLIPNKNGTLGVLWSAVDAGKKTSLVEALRFHNRDHRDHPWSANVSSTGTLIFRRVPTIPDGRAAIAALPTGLYGSAGIFRCRITGQLYVDVSIGAIAESSLPAVIHHFAPGWTLEKLQARLHQEREESERKQAEFNAAYQLERQANRRKYEHLLRLATAHLTPFYDWKPAPGKYIFIADTYPSPALKIRTIEKRGGRLCAINKEGKGKVIDADSILKLAAKGLIWKHEETHLAALQAAFKAESTVARASCPEPQNPPTSVPPERSPAPTPAPSPAPSPARSALTLF
jgi:hypothetical protein